MRRAALVLALLLTTACGGGEEEPRTPPAEPPREIEPHVEIGIAVVSRADLELRGHRIVDVFRRRVALHLVDAPGIGGHALEAVAYDKYKVDDATPRDASYFRYTMGPVDYSLTAATCTWSAWTT